MTSHIICEGRILAHKYAIFAKTLEAPSPTHHNKKSPIYAKNHQIAQ